MPQVSSLCYSRVHIINFLEPLYISKRDCSFIVDFENIKTNDLESINRSRLVWRGVVSLLSWVGRAGDRRVSPGWVPD